MKKYHFIGIGGIGMSGLARLLISKDTIVTGSDISPSPILESLAQAGIKIFTGHSAQNVVPDATVIYSTDIKSENPEYQAALRLKCKMLHRSHLLQKIMESYQALAVAGTHGKTTTSSLLAYVLKGCGQSPSYAIGGVIPQLTQNAGKGTGKYFVAEACESDGTILNYIPYGAIVTNVDNDHMDHYKTEEALNHTFKSFMDLVTSPNHLFWCRDDERLKMINLGKSNPGISYGFDPSSDLCISNFEQNGWRIVFDAKFKGVVYKGIEVSLIGKHNALNALAVFGLALSLGLEENSIRAELRTFGGVKRRCEKKGEINGVLFLDDYGHHPTELKATLNSIRKSIGDRRLIAIYQPHRYSRAKECMGCYKNVFNEVDLLIVPEIYAARESSLPGVTHEKIIEEIKNDLGNRVEHVPRNILSEKLSLILKPHDVVVTLGAGDVTKVSEETIELLTSKKATKLKVGVIYGGMSVEHDISMISSENIMNAIKNELYDIDMFWISKQGQWFEGTHAEIKEKLSDSFNTSISRSAKISGDTMVKLLSCDVLFPVLHGPYGEDGTMQGMFDVFSKAYVGCDHRASAIAMDKVMTKKLCNEAGIPTAKYVSFDFYEWKTFQKEIEDKISQELNFPLFVKPVHLGSSIGVTKVESQDELVKAIVRAFRLDDRLVVENGFEDVREIEFSVLGDGEIVVYPPGEIFTNGELHDYDKKYGLNPNMSANAFVAKANLKYKQLEEGMELAKKSYKAIGCSGMARVDTFLDANGKFWLNEINPIPGFTATSLYPIMCQANGLSLSDLIDKLIVLSLKRRRMKDRLEVDNQV